jgi:hypothetical protein
MSQGFGVSSALPGASGARGALGFHRGVVDVVGAAIGRKLTRLLAPAFTRPASAHGHARSDRGRWEPAPSRLIASLRVLR